LPKKHGRGGRHTSQPSLSADDDFDFDVEIKDVSMKNGLKRKKTLGA
jgi:hypothetical protein